jgi:hypothetical protein
MHRTTKRVQLRCQELKVLSERANEEHQRLIAQFSDLKRVMGDLRLKQTVLEQKKEAAAALFLEAQYPMEMAMEEARMAHNF